VNFVNWMLRLGATVSKAGAAQIKAKKEKGA